MIYASDKTQSSMRSWCKAQGFNISKSYSGKDIKPEDFDFHITIVASKNPVFVPITQHQIQPIKLKPYGFEALGVEQKVPTIRFEPSTPLKILREFYIKTYGIQPTFENFKPHMTVSYSWKGRPKLDKVSLPTFPLIFDQLIVKDFEA